MKGGELMNKPKIIATYTYEQVFKCQDRCAVVFGAYSRWIDWGYWEKNQN